MSTPDTKKRLVIARNAGLVLALVAIGPFAYQKGLSFLRSDAFASLRGSGKAKPAGIELGKADIRHYRGQKLMSKAVANKVKIDSQRSTFELYDITNGVYNTEKGSVEFAAREATYNAPLRTLFVRKEVNVKNKDVNLKTSEMQFNEKTGILEAKKEISGKLFDGQVKAVTLRYNANTGAFVGGATHWVGKVSTRLQDGAATQTPTKWDIQGDDYEYKPANTTAYYSDATATDGEIILKAPKVEYNRKTDVVVALGGATYYSSEANLVADKVTVYRKEKRAVLEGHVVMLVKPESEQDKPAKVEPIPEFKRLVADQVNVKPSSAPKTPEEKKAIEDLRSNETMRKYPAQIACDWVEYFYGKGNRKANIKGNPQARQDFTSGLWRHMWADHAFYDGEKEELTMFAQAMETNRARQKNAYGDNLHAFWFKVSTKKDDDKSTGKDVKGDVYSTDEEEKPAKAGGDQKATTTTGGGTTGGTTGGGTPPPTKTGG